ncbi:MAG: ABC transporter permease subunit [Gemmatimonadaceae bacterium]
MTHIQLASPPLAGGARPLTAAALPRVLALAAFELRSTMRGKMVPTFAAVFAVVAAGLALAGLGGSGQLLVQGFTRTAVSLMTLGYYIMPLLGLLLGAMAFAANSAAMEAIAAQPVGVAELVLGRALGLLAAIVLVVVAGFGGAMVFIAASAGTAGIGGFLLVALGSVLAGAAGLAVGILLGVVSRSRLGAMGGAIAAWLFAAVVFDLIAIGVLQLVGDGQPGRWLLALLGLNPIDGLRAVSLVELGADVLLGPAGAALERMLGGAAGLSFVAVSLTLWIAVPLAAAVTLSSRRDR